MSVSRNEMRFNARSSSTVSSCISALLKPYLCYNYSALPKSIKTLTAMTTIDESDVGISFFISQLPGFRGILKQRYADFIVNEVDTDGNVVHLTCLDAPPETQGVKEENGTKKPDELCNTYTSEIESFRSLAGDSDAEQLEALINQIKSGNENDIGLVVFNPSSDKSHRTAVHKFFKENLKFLVTDTVDGPDSSSKCIRVRWNSGGANDKGRNNKKRKERGDKPFDSRGSDHWPEDLGKFVRFHLYKENKDTQEALGVIGKMLGIQPKSFGFAGTKDKRAVTTQRVTVFKQSSNKLAALNKRLIGIKVGNFCHVDEGLVLGNLLGNRFTITLRGVVADSEDTIKASADSLGRNGFINYFGLQRFGSGSIPTHLIGAALFRGEWKTVVSMILDPREGEKSEINKVRQYYKETGDIDGTIRKLPRHLVAEKAILQCLKKLPGNYLQALKAIPRTLRMMYVHSYQSYLWNHAASMRVQKYGTSQVVLGDLVYCKGDDTKEVSGGLTSECEDDCPIDETLVTDLPPERNDLVKAVTEEDLQAGNYTIDDVVLPMPGSRVTYPLNNVAEVYNDLAKKDDINLTESAHGVKEFSITGMTGGYRRVFQKPIDFEHELLTYTDGNIPLSETDLEKIAKVKPVQVPGEVELANRNQGKDTPVRVAQSESLEKDMKIATELNEENAAIDAESLQPESIRTSDSPQTLKALKLAFTLPSSCYATMAIRELLKTSTSVSFHKALN